MPTWNLHRQILVWFGWKFTWASENATNTCANCSGKFSTDFAGRNYKANDCSGIFDYKSNIHLWEWFSFKAIPLFFLNFKFTHCFFFFHSFSNQWELMFCSVSPLSFSKRGISLLYTYDNCFKHIPAQIDDPAVGPWHSNSTSQPTTSKESEWISLNFILFLFFIFLDMASYLNLFKV